MQVRIGVQSVLKELVVEVDQTPDEVRDALARALETDNGIFVLDGEKGGRVMIPASSVGYLELPEPEGRQVGFGNAL